MSAQGTQSPPLEATSRVDPLGNVNIRGDKAQGIKGIDQRVDQFGEGKEQNITADTSTGGGQDILKASEVARESAEAFECNRR